MVNRFLDMEFVNNEWAEELLLNVPTHGAF